MKPRRKRESVKALLKRAQRTGRAADWNSYLKAVGMGVDRQLRKEQHGR